MRRPVVGSSSDRTTWARGRVGSPAHNWEIFPATTAFLSGQVLTYSSDYWLFQRSNGLAAVDSNGNDTFRPVPAD